MSGQITICVVGPCRVTLAGFVNWDVVLGKHYSFVFCQIEHCHRGRRSLVIDVSKKDDSCLISE